MRSECQGVRRRPTSSACVNYFPRMTQFGWRVTSAGGAGGFITSKWMTEFNDDIKTLQNMIKHHSAYTGLGTRTYNKNSDKINTKQCHSECCETTNQRDLSTDSSLVTESNQVMLSSAPEKVLNSTPKKVLSSTPEKVLSSTPEKVLSSTPEKVLSSTPDKLERALSNRSSLCDSGFEESLSHDRVHIQLTFEEEETQGTVGNSLSSSPDHDTRPATPKSEECCSMQSVASRDSGFCATDDVHADFLREPPGNRSLLEELEGVYTDHELPTESYLARIPCPEAAGEDSQERAKSPAWYTRFSFGEYHSLSPGTLCLALGRSPGDLSSITVDSNDNELTNNTSSFTDEPDEAEYLGVADNCKEVSGRDRRRKLGVSGGNLGASSHSSGSPRRDLSEAKEIIHDFCRLSDRLKNLSTDLESLTLEASESRQDFRSMECRTSQLVNSAVASRVRISRLYALQVLEERLQEEWWAAYNPDTLPLHENYIV